MNNIYFTVAGLSHYFGVKLFKEGMELILEKEEENDYDNEAIVVKLAGLGKVGYVANSVNTVLGDTFSAGRLYDKFENKAKAKVVYLIEERNSIICEFIAE